MKWSEGNCDGFALAAAACEDAEADRAAPGLALAVRELALSRARTLARAERGARRNWVRSRLRHAAAPSRELPGRPPRALALLASRVDRALGRRWLAGAPPPRAGFVAEAALVELLCDIAARADERDPHDEHRGS